MLSGMIVVFAYQIVRRILLLLNSLRSVMGILIADRVSQLFRARIMAITEMLWNRTYYTVPYIF